MNHSLLLICILLLAIAQRLDCFFVKNSNYNTRKIKYTSSSMLNMKWTFSGEAGSMKDLGAIGPEGL